MISDAGRDTLAREARPRLCAWCRTPLDAPATRLGGRLRCSACGVDNTDPWPSPEELDAAYAAWYRPEEGRFAGAGDLFLRRSRGLLARRLDAIAPPGRVLDVGAGAGVLLDALRSAGREAIGVERRSTRPDVFERDLWELEGSFAAVVLWHALEHLPEPGRALDHCASLLAPSGVMVVSLPNASSLQARAFGERWFALDLPRHLVHVPARALIERLERLGLRIERVSHLRGGQVLFGWLHGLVAALPGHPDLYDAIRRPAARREPMGPARRTVALAAAVVASPLAAAAAAAEVALHRGGTVYVEARRA